MLCQQVIARMGDLLGYILAGRGGGINRDVAFTVKTERAIVEIGRADTQILVVDDQNFGVNVNRRAASGKRVKDPESIIFVSPL